MKQNTQHNPGPIGKNILHPDLPFDMKPRINKAVEDIHLRQVVSEAAQGKNAKRRKAFYETFGERLDEVRIHAGNIKQHVLDHLDHYLETFTENAENTGAVVHYAVDAAEARSICLSLASAAGCRLCVKSKSMVTEEINLVSVLQEAGIETIETDLGEFIVQLDGDAPSHIVTPMIHKDRYAVAETFSRELGSKYAEEPEVQTRIARDYMRNKFRKADLGVSGANFLVAESGSIVLCTNEGNGCMTTGMPDLHIVFAGIEKLIPRISDLAVFLKLLARSSTAQPLTVYTSIITGPRRSSDMSGPRQLHIILVDNGRTKVLQEESREILRCIRCGACLNICPVFRSVGGGHAYGSVYSGPIGAALTPNINGLNNYPDLPQASSLCGACYEVCPVHIDLPSQLIRLRRDLVSYHQPRLYERLAYRFWAKILQHLWLYRISVKIQRILLRQLAAGVADGKDKYIQEAPFPLSLWTDKRDLPAPAREDFRTWWRKRNGKHR